MKLDVFFPAKKAQDVRWEVVLARTIIMEVEIWDNQKLVRF